MASRIQRRHAHVYGQRWFRKLNYNHIDLACFWKMYEGTHGCLWCSPTHLYVRAERISQLVCYMCYLESQATFGASAYLKILDGMMSNRIVSGRLQVTRLSLVLHLWEIISMIVYQRSAMSRSLLWNIIRVNQGCWAAMFWNSEICTAIFRWPICFTRADNAPMLSQLHALQKSYALVFDQQLFYGWFFNRLDT